MSELPAPLTPLDCDLRDFPWMPIDITRLFNSEFHARSDDTAWRTGVTLWLKSYHQVPAASIPTDDISLARLAELGRDLKTWRKVKADALRGWKLCRDGRLYHPTVSEKALEGWLDKLAQRKLSAAGNATRHGTPFDPAPFENAMRDSLARLSALNPNSRALGKRFVKAGAKRTLGTPAGAPVDLPLGSEMPPTGSERGSRRELGGIPSVASQAPDGSKKPSQRDPVGTPAGAPVDLPLGSQENRTEQNPPSPPSGVSPPSPTVDARTLKGADRGRGTRLPASWTLDATGRNYAAESGLTPLEIDAEAVKFRDWWSAKAGADARKADWAATWRTWVRKAVEWRGRIVVPNRPGVRAPAVRSAFVVRGVPVPEANVIPIVERWRDGGDWHIPFGPPPDDPACEIPIEWLERGGVRLGEPRPTQGPRH